MHPSRRAAIVAFCVGVAAVGSGCFTVNPAMHVRATGEALAVDGRGDGLRLRQGAAVLDEQDFYEVAGDGPAVIAVRTHRAKLGLEQLGDNLAGFAGIAGLVVGGGGLAAGIVWVTQSGPIGLVALLPGALILVGSIVAVPVGFSDAATVGEELDDPVLPAARAAAAARRYNASLAGKRRRGS